MNLKYKKFIGKNLRVSSDYEQNLSQLKLLSNFISRNVIDADELLLELISDETVGKILGCIVNYNIKLIKNDKILEISNDSFIIDLIESYCIDNNMISYDDYSSIDDNYGLYLKDVNQYRLLTPEEEKKFGLRVMLNDKEAIRILTLSNLRLVIKFVKRRYSNYHIDPLDLIQEGNMGLMEAVIHFDPNRGYKFSTYATFWIRKYINDYIFNRNDFIRIPYHAGVAIRKYQTFCQKFYQNYGYYPSNSELEENLKMSESKIEELMKYNFQIASFSQPIDDDKNTLIDVIKDDNESVIDFLENKGVRQIIDDMLKTNILSSKEIDIIKKYFGFEGEQMTYQEIAKLYGVSKEAIRLNLKHAYKQIRKYIEENNLYDDLDINIFCQKK